MPTGELPIPSTPGGGAASPPSGKPITIQLEDVDPQLVHYITFPSPGDVPNIRDIDSRSAEHKRVQAVENSNYERDPASCRAGVVLGKHPALGLPMLPVKTGDLTKSLCTTDVPNIAMGEIQATCEDRYHSNFHSRHHMRLRQEHRSINAPIHGAHPFRNKSGGDPSSS